MTRLFAEPSRHYRWNPVRADRLMQLRWLQSEQRNWQHWWEKVCLSTTKVNPGWAANDN